MVSQLYRVRAGHCAHCGAQAPLYVLDITRDELPRLREAEPSEIGLCVQSWGKVRTAIKRGQLDAYYAKQRARKAPAGTAK